MLYILDEKTDTCNCFCLKYILGLIFWVEKSVPAIGQVSDIYLAAYFI